MDVSSFVTSIVTSVVIFVVLVALYTGLSRLPGNHVVYYPNRLRKGLGPPKSGPFAWIREAWQASEDEIIARGGLDARVYIIFLHSMFSILVLTACYGLPVLLAVCITDSNNAANADAATNIAFDNLAMGNVKRRSPRIWAFVIGAYWMSVCTYAVLWRSYRHVVDLRMRELSSPIGRPEHFTVLVRDIPKPKAYGKTSYAQELNLAFRRLHPESYVRNLVVVDTRKVGELWNKMQKYKLKVARAEAEMEDGHRPQQRDGLWGLFGKKMDAIEFYNGKIRELLLEWEVERERALRERQQRAAFVVFNSRAAAYAAGQVLYFPKGSEWSVESAPDPRGVIWENLPIRHLPDRVLRRAAVYTIVFLTICFYMIPIAAISAVITLPQLEQKLPFLKPVVRLPIMRTILPAYVPQIALIVFLAVLPCLLQRLSQFEGLASKAETERAAAGKYFYFNVFNVFLGITLATSLFNVLKMILESPPTRIIDLLTESLPPQATFFITFISLKFLVGYGLILSRLDSLVMYHLKRMWICKTEQEKREAWKPDSLPYANLVPSDMVVATIALCYAIMAPMVLPFTIAYFACAWLVMRNQVLNVHFPVYESNGRMWPHIHARILAALFLSQLTMLGLFGAKAGSNFAISLVMVVLPIATLIYAFLSKLVHFPPFKDNPFSAAASTPLSHAPSVPAIIGAYTPACLAGNDAFDSFEDLLDDKFEDANSTLSSSTPSGLMSPA